jgi:hypothetical protein
MDDKERQSISLNDALHRKACAPDDPRPREIDPVMARLRKEALAKKAAARSVMAKAPRAEDFVTVVNTSTSEISVNLPGSLYTPAATRFAACQAVRILRSVWDEHIAPRQIAALALVVNA